MNTILSKTDIFLLGIIAISVIVGPIAGNYAQATICPIDQFSKHIEAANVAYNEQNYVELKNSLDAMQELVDATEEEE